MESFSWSDSFHAAISACMPCLAREAHDHDRDDPTNSGYQRLPQNLEHLLQDTEAETLSLHSNIGDAARRRRKKRQARRITFFGFDLFGKPKPPIHLDEDEDDDEDDDTLRRSRASASSAGFDSDAAPLDSDAAPLDSAAIDSMTPEQLQERARAAEEEERRAKEERRERRRTRREVKRLAQALAAGSVDGGAFEGFQGSAGAYPHIPSPGFYSTPPPPPSHPDVDAEADDGADLDGGMYVGRREHHGSSGGSDSRLTSSDASSQIRRHSQQLAHLPSLTPSSLPVKKKKTSSKSKSRSSGTSSQSQSLASPVGQSFPQRLASKGDVVDESGFPSRGLSMGGDRHSFRSARGGAFLANHGAD
ncbi:hypothetical protein IW261DRAFT_1419027 [Armillaria novae-zelandiae]|uniref:Uncharacterized protein n=1 Tax=Armillaria novae-zelandiae TaxID=153914 RepID=A0AA39UBQ2_9AGAR|nr:hypothetical protein IW261DRAFT_1419027 [Armillaria novae-zelandiae]